VEDHLIARSELVQARAEVLGTGTVREPGGVDTVGGQLSGIV
jgi:hypothetical protein